MSQNSLRSRTRYLRPIVSPQTVEPAAHPPRCRRLSPFTATNSVNSVSSSRGPFTCECYSAGRNRCPCLIDYIKALVLSLRRSRPSCIVPHIRFQIRPLNGANCAILPSNHKYLPPKAEMADQYVENLLQENKVEFRRLGKSGLIVSNPILGAMSFGSEQWQDWVINEEKALPLLKAAWDRGLNTWDTGSFFNSPHLIH